MNNRIIGTLLALIPALACAPIGAANDPSTDGSETGAGGINHNGADGCNSSRYDFPGNGEDEDCDGTPDNGAGLCDAGLGLDSSSPIEATKAIGLCQLSEGGSWGVVSANYVKADGSDGMSAMGHGLMDTFGVVGPKEGQRLLALSSGYARTPSQPGWHQDHQAGRMAGPTYPDLGTTSPTPPGYPKPSSSCPNAPKQEALARDPSALEVTIRTPHNAKGLRFDFNFYTAEFPNFICREWNDFFVVLMDPPPPTANDGNISFDKNGDHVSVNNAFLDVCTQRPTAQTGDKLIQCNAGPSDLAGTGYDGDPDPFASVETTIEHAATGWLRTSAPVDGGTDITLRFAVWDQGDANLNTLVLIDNFQWEEHEVETVTERPPR